MSRRFTGPLRTILPALAAGLVALGVAGCSSGQVTQTDSAAPAVNGNHANAGDVALRDILVSYPPGGSYAAGDDAPLTLTIVNTGGTDDELTSVSSPAAASVELIGRASLPARSGLQVIVPPASEETSAEPSEPTATESAPPSGPSATSSEPEPTPSVTETAPEDIGTMSIVLTGLTKNLAIGKNVPITFVFAEAGQVTINVPIDTPEQAREEAAAE